MPTSRTLLDRLLALVGLDLDFDVDLHAEKFSLVHDGLWVGARPVPRDVPTLRERGVTHVVSCLEPADHDGVAFLAAHFHHDMVAVRDSRDVDLAASFDAFCALADRARADGALLVHCEKGVSRSATLAISAVMQRDRVGFAEAFERVRAGRGGVRPNIGFASQLYRLERELALAPPQNPSSLARYLREVCLVPVDVDVLHDQLERHDHDAPAAIRAIFGDEIPRVVQGAW